MCKKVACVGKYKCFVADAACLDDRCEIGSEDQKHIIHGEKQISLGAYKIWFSS